MQCDFNLTLSAGRIKLTRNNSKDLGQIILLLIIIFQFQKKSSWGYHHQLVQCNHSKTFILSKISFYLGMKNLCVFVAPDQLALVCS